MKYKLNPFSKFTCSSVYLSLFGMKLNEYKIYLLKGKHVEKEKVFKIHDNIKYNL
jgi:hypothetical protein